MAKGRTPTLPTVRQAHPALRPGHVRPPGDDTIEMPARPALRRQELAPWSPHPPAADAGPLAATPPAGTPEVARDEAPAGASPAGRHRRARRGVAWVVIGGIGLYLVIIALGLAGVLYVGRLSPPGLDRLTRPSGSTQVTTGADGNADPASPGPVGPTVGPAGAPAETTAPAPGSTTASGVDSGADGDGTTSTAPGDSDPSSASDEPSSPPPSTEPSTTAESTTTTTAPPGPDAETPSGAHPHGGPPGQSPDRP